MDGKLEEVLEGFRELKLAVIGDVMLDRWVWGDVERISPEAPIPIVKVHNITKSPGGAANVAMVITLLNAHLDLYCVLGNDINGNILMDLCREKNIQIFPFYDSHPTIVKERVIARNQQIVRIDYGEENLKKIEPEIQREILELLRGNISDYDALILSDYNKKMFTENFTKEIIEMANSFEIPTIVDPKPSNIDFFKGCTVLCPNKEEAEKISGIKYRDYEDLIKIGERLCERVSSKYAIVTCDKQGAFIYNNGDYRMARAIAEPDKVSDVTGAGDTFAGTLALGLASKLDIYDSVKLANCAAGFSVEGVGIANPEGKDVIEYFKRYHQELS